MWLDARRRAFRRRDERGAALALIALSVVSLMSVMGVVIDGSHAFAQRRQMQNSADAAALAGARALDKVVQYNEQAIWNAVVNAAVVNGASSGQITCRLANDVLTDIGACPTAATGTAPALRATASAVRVTVGATQNTSFMRVVGTKTFNAKASASAQIEALRSGSSPFLICAVGNTDPRALGDGQATPILLPDNSINPLALGTNGGPVYELQDPTTAGCGQGNQFKGLAEDATGTYTLPRNREVAIGDHGINIAKSVVAGNYGCRDSFTMNCVVLVPLCHAMTPAVAGQLYCVRWGAFQIVDIQGSSRLGGRLISGAMATGGQGGGLPLGGEARVIKISE